MEGNQGKHSRDIDTVWQAALTSLHADANPDANPDATQFMKVLCLLAPEAIPESLFQAKDIDYPDEWKFLASDNMRRFDDAITELLRLSLIQFDVDIGFSICRLTQLAYFDRMPLPARSSAFEMAFALLRKAFPQRSGKVHLYQKWRTCQELHQHVQAMHKSYTSMRRDSFPRQSSEYRQLIRDTAWYMLEIQDFIGAEKMLLSVLPEIEESSSEYAESNQDLMGIYERTGRSNRAVECAQASFQIILAKGSVFSGNELANAYSDMGYSLCSAFRAAEALSYLDKAVELAKQHREPECFENFSLDRFLRNRARSYQQLGMFDQALANLDEAESCQLKLHGKDSHYDGEAKHERAKIAAWQGNLDEALALSAEACRLVRKGKPTYSSVGAAYYIQGWICLLKKDLDTALLHFEQALAICQLNESNRGNKGESARVKWRMAQIYDFKGQNDNALLLLEEAEETKRTLHSTGDYAVVDDEDRSWDSLLGLLYR